MLFSSTSSFRRGVLLSSVLNLLPRASSFLLTVLIAAAFGATGRSDIYFYLFSTINLIAIFIRGINGAVLLPEYAHLVEKEGRGPAMGFLNFYFWLVLAIGLVFTVVFLAAPLAAWRLISSFPVESLRDNLPALQVAAAGLVPTIALYFLSDVMIANKLFGLPSVAGAIPYGLSLVAMALLRNGDPAWVVILLGCWAVGCGLGAVALAAFLAQRAGWQLLQVDFNRHLVAEKNIVYAQSGNLFTLLAVQIPAYYLSGQGSGAVSIISYARTLAAIPRAFFTDHVSLVAGISFNEIYARKDFKELDRMFFKCALLMFLLLFPPVTFAALYYQEISDAFSVFSSSLGHNTVLVVQVTAIMMLALPWQAVDSLSARLFMAGRAIATSFIIQIVSNTLLIVVTVWFLRRWGEIGYAWAMPLTTILFTLSGTPFLLKKIFPWTDYWRLVRRCLLVAVVSLALVLGIRSVMPHGLWMLLVAGLLYLAGLGLILFAGGFGADLKNNFREYKAAAFSQLRRVFFPNRPD
jgi:putative peptidoglycan lipid II flippase